MSESRRRPLPHQAFQAAAEADTIPPIEPELTQSELVFRPADAGQGDGAGRPANDIAMRILTDYAVMADASAAVFWFNGSYWERQSEQWLRSLALSIDTHLKTSAKKRREAADYVVSSTFRNEIPWRRLAPMEVPCLNGVVDVDSGSIRAHRKEDYLETVLPWEYDPAARCPTWERILNDYFAADDCGIEKIAALQEFFGYILMPHAQYKKALLLHGQSNTGKSVIVQTIQDLVGKGNHCSISTEDLGDPRKREDIVGKMVNLVTELPVDAMIADGGFKQLVSTGDSVTIDPKHRRRFSYQPFAKHIIACNTLPSMSDQTRATVNRLLLITFTRVFAPEEQDRDLRAKIFAEMKGILNWAVAGASALIANGGDFTRITEEDRLIERYRQANNPILSFLQDGGAIKDPEGRIAMLTFREKLFTYTRKGYSPRQINGMLDGARIETTELADESGRSARYIIGWRLPGM